MSRRNGRDPQDELEPQLLGLPSGEPEEPEPAKPGKPAAKTAKAPKGATPAGPQQRGAVAALVHLGLLVPTLAVAAGAPAWWVTEADVRRLTAYEQPTEDTPIAAAADEGYCTPELKKILRRVLQSCGLTAGGDGRGCQPLEAKSVAALSGQDFNALFTPLADRAGIIQFSQDSDELDTADQALLDSLFADQRGASWFFVVARSSPEGSDLYNRDLSQRRGNSVLGHLKQKFGDHELDDEVGLLWLGEEFAQLDQEYCKWHRSGDFGRCNGADLNRSAFVAWIDCRL